MEIAWSFILVMKTTLTLAVAAVTLFASGVSEARTYVVVEPVGYHHHHHHHGMSLQARAQARLRRLGYYHGPVDGDFGPGSRRALVRFQRDSGLAVTGWLDVRTQRSLGI